MKIKTLVIGAVALVLVGGAAYAVREYRIEAGRCDTVEALDARAPSADPATVTVVGDSYAAGWGLGDDEAAWPALLGVEGVDVSAAPGAGWTREGLCDRPTIPDLVAQQAPASTLIVQAGLNDTLVSFSDDSIRRAVAAVGGRADRIVIVGPASTDGFDDEEKVDAVMQLGVVDLEVSGEPVTYVSLLDLDVPMQEDGMHPSIEGHALIAERVRAALD